MFCGKVLQIISLNRVVCLKRTACLVAFLFVAIAGVAQVTLECDYSTVENRRNPMHYHWDISNRISPMNRFNMPVGENPYINVVRPLGGKSKNDEKVIDEDTYKWDGEKYYYDWEPLKQQINTVRAKARIFQLMIDNPPWAFQRGIDFQGRKEVETYGNAWPPNDPEAWSRYIQNMLEELVKTYGKVVVEQWRFCIGREIGTKGHWQGTRLEFFEHYRNTQYAIHSVLPHAKVGTHFLWASSNHSYGPDFVKWCALNDVNYDFVGVSYYPFYNRLERVDIEHVYAVDFAPIKDIPEWNPEAQLEVHEFALITSLSSRGNSYQSASRAHQESFTVMLAKMMYEHDIYNVFRWGTGEDKVAEQIFSTMKGNSYYTSSKQGSEKINGNMINAVFARDESLNQKNVMIYNYNGSPSAKKKELVQVVTTLAEAPGTEMKYRIAAFENDQLNWSDWKTSRAKAIKQSEYSKLTIETELPPFSFQKIEIRPLKSVGLRRAVTNRETGKKTEVELIDIKRGKLVCSAKGRRFYIPLATLCDDDLEFLKKWYKEK